MFIDVWRAGLARFDERQRLQRAREFIQFSEIVEWCTDLGRPPDPYAILQRDLLDDRFDRVAILHPAITRTKMTPEWMRNVMEVWPAEQPRQSYLGQFYTPVADTVRCQYLAFCWIPRADFIRWCEWHELPIDPPRFRPAASPTSAANAAPVNSENPQIADSAEGAAANAAPTPRRRGRADQYEQADRALFPVITEMLATGRAHSANDAARMLDEAGRILGSGTPDSRTRRLAQKYRDQAI
jgi:hypothetical protein